MGFGILLVGYFLTFATALASSYFFADIPGSIIIVYAISKLSKYGDGFKKTLPVTMVFSLSCVLSALLHVFEFNQCFTLVADTFRMAVILVMHIFLFKSLEVMAKGADDEKLAAKAKRNLIIVMGYYTVYITGMALRPVFDDVMKNYFDFALYIYGIIYVVLNLLLLHSAYAKLYIDGTDNNEAFPEFKESKLSFINPIRRRFYESQKKAHEENYKLMKESAEAARNNQSPQRKKKKKS